MTTVKKHGLVVPYTQEEFNDLLVGCHRERNSFPQSSPTLGHQEINLFELYNNVISEGGWSEVCIERKWKSIVNRYNFSATCTNSTYALKQIYLRNLLFFEEKYFSGFIPPPSKTIPSGLRVQWEKLTGITIKDEGSPDSTPLAHVTAPKPPPGPPEIKQAVPPIQKKLRAHATSQPLGYSPSLRLNFTRASRSVIKPVAVPVVRRSSAGYDVNELPTQQPPSKPLQLAFRAPPLVQTLGDEYRQLHYGGQKGCLQKLHFSLQSGLANEIDWALHVLLVLSNENDPECILYFNHSPKLLSLILQHAIFYDEIPLKNGRKIYYKNLFDFGNREEQEITEERLYVICIILYNFSVLNQNAIFMTESASCMDFLLKCVTKPRVQQRTKLICLRTFSNLSLFFSVDNMSLTFREQYLHVVFWNILYSPDRSALSYCLEVISKVCRNTDNYAWLTSRRSRQFFSRDFYQKLLSLFCGAGDAQLTLSALDTCYHLTFVSAVQCWELITINGCVGALCSLLLHDCFVPDLNSEVKILERPICLSYGYYKSLRAARKSQKVEKKAIKKRRHILDECIKQAVERKRLLLIEEQLTLDNQKLRFNAGNANTDPPLGAAPINNTFSYASNANSFSTDNINNGSKVDEIFDDDLNIRYNRNCSDEQNNNTFNQSKNLVNASVINYDILSNTADNNISCHNSSFLELENSSLTVLEEINTVNKNRGSNSLNMNEIDKSNTNYSNYNSDASELNSNNSIDCNNVSNVDNENLNTFDETICDFDSIVNYSNLSHLENSVVTSKTPLENVNKNSSSFIVEKQKKISTETFVPHHLASGNSSYVINGDSGTKKKDNTNVNTVSVNNCIVAKKNSLVENVTTNDIIITPDNNNNHSNNSNGDSNNNNFESYSKNITITKNCVNSSYIHDINEQNQKTSSHIVTSRARMDRQETPHTLKLLINNFQQEFVEINWRYPAACDDISEGIQLTAALILRNLTEKLFREKESSSQVYNLFSSHLSLLRNLSLQKRQFSKALATCLYYLSYRQ